MFFFWFFFPVILSMTVTCRIFPVYCVLVRLEVSFCESPLGLHWYGPAPVADSSAAALCRPCCRSFCAFLWRYLAQQLLLVGRSQVLVRLFSFCGFSVGRVSSVLCLYSTDFVCQGLLRGLIFTDCFRFILLVFCLRFFLYSRLCFLGFSGGFCILSRGFSKQCCEPSRFSVLDHCGRLRYYTSAVFIQRVVSWVFSLWFHAS